MHVKILGSAVNAAVLAYHLAENGHKVLWKPYDEQIKLQLMQNDILFDDYQLTHGIQQQILENRIFLEHVENDENFNICVLAINNQQYIEFEQFSSNFKQYYRLIVNYSNLGLGASEDLKRRVSSDKLVYIPDFIQDGNHAQSFLTENLIVGCDDNELISIVKELFRPIFQLSKQFYFMSIKAAEFTKLSISGFLATKISFMNDLSNVAESLGVDIEEVRVAMSTDSRVGHEYLHPGCGFGGANFSRDIIKLKNVVEESGYASGLLDKIWAINENQKEIVFRKIWQLFNCDLKDKVIAFWGAAFRPNSNSVAQAPILKVLEACWSQGAVTRVHDPRALMMLKSLYPDQKLLQICHDQYQAIEGADVVCLMTEWKQYWSPDYMLLSRKMQRKNIIDGRNIYNPIYVENQGFNYIGIGR